VGQLDRPVGVHAAAREALTLALSGMSAGAARQVLRRQLRAGSLTPAAPLDAIGWTGRADGVTVDPATAVRAALRAVITLDANPDTVSGLTTSGGSPDAQREHGEAESGDRQSRVEEPAGRASAQQVVGRAQRATDPAEESAGRDQGRSTGSRGTGAPTHADTAVAVARLRRTSRP